MFDLRKFVMDTICGMVGKEPDYKVRKYALGWLEKDVLVEEDLATVEEYIENPPSNEITETEGELIPKDPESETL